MRRVSALVGFCLVALGVHAAGAQPVLHELFDFSEDEQDFALPPKAVPSNVEIVPPDQVPDDPALVNAGIQAPATEKANQQYGLDGNTSKPDRVGYSDPFTPSIPPFKRMYAYDSVNPELQLVVAKPALKPVKVGGGVRSSDDQFFGELDILLTAGEPLRLPTVGPGYRVVNARLNPGARFELLTDSADNLFVRSDETGTRQWVVHLTIQRAVFGSAFADVPLAKLAAKLPKLPAVVAKAAAPVLEHIGVSRAERPAVVVRRLVEYFRGFEPEEVTLGSQGIALYREIALSQRGVCRHRAFAFTVTALAFGLPTRFVRNEAHAWVEVTDGNVWHRIDLGGAAGEMSLTSQLDVPHEVPADPYTWPPQSESGQSMVARALGGGGDGSPGGHGASDNEDGQRLDQTPGGMPAPTEPSAVEDEAAVQDQPVEPTRLSMTFAGATLKRGERFALKGTAGTASGQRCSLMRVDVQLYDKTSGVSHSVGTLVTDSNGKYAGELVLPLRVPVGDYRVRVRSPGNQSCGPSE